MEHGYININASNIYYEINGQGENLIFVHGDGLDLRQWDKQVVYFSKKYRVICYDQRGFGRSQIPLNQPYSFSEDLYLLMKALSIKNAHLVGLSLGGAEIINFALAHPYMVKSLVLADSGINGDGFSSGFKENIQTVLDLAKKGKLDDSKKHWMKLPVFDISRHNPQTWNTIQEMVTQTSGYRWYGNNQPKQMNPPAIERLSEITSPTLILVGENDIDDFKRKSQLLHNKIRKSTLSYVKNAGHISNMDNPTEFNRLVDEFLSTL